jgi:ABC-type multidrug transport system ATPase subunit
VRSLSGGQRQAVAIARAVYFNAKILIMDEPTAALGPAETAQVRNLVRQLKAEGIAILLISHDIHDVYDLSDRVSVMYHGRIVDTVNKHDVSTDDILGMIILGKKPGDVTAADREELELRGCASRAAARRPDRVAPTTRIRPVRAFPPARWLSVTLARTDSESHPRLRRASRVRIRMSEQAAAPARSRAGALGAALTRRTRRPFTAMTCGRRAGSRDLTARARL